jgi:hypothetical protein
MTHVVIGVIGALLVSISSVVDDPYFLKPRGIRPLRATLRGVMVVVGWCLLCVGNWPLTTLFVFSSTLLLTLFVARHQTRCETNAQMFVMAILRLAALLMMGWTSGPFGLVGILIYICATGFASPWHQTSQRVTPESSGIASIAALSGLCLLCLGDQRAI